MPFHGDDSDAIVNQPMQLFVLIGGHRDLQFSTVVDKAWATFICVRGEQLLVERPTDVMQNNTRFWRTQNGRHTLLLLALPIASCCGGLYCARCSYARREYAMWSWHPYACTMSRRSGWQGWWPGSCRRRISIEMAGDLTLCGHRGKRRRERTAGELRVRTAR